MVIATARVKRRASRLVCCEWLRVVLVLLGVVMFADAASSAPMCMFPQVQIGTACASLCPAGQTASATSGTCVGGGITCEAGSPVGASSCCPNGQAPATKAGPNGLIYTGACCPQGQSPQPNGSCLPELVIICQAGQSPANNGCCLPGQAATNRYTCCPPGQAPQPNGSCGTNPCRGAPANYGTNPANPTGPCIAICPPGQRAVPGSNACVCPDGYAPKDGKCDRNPCGPGERLNSADLCEVVVCPPGYEIDKAANNCRNPCPGNRVPDPNMAGTCVCPGPTTLNPTTKECSCPGDFILLDGKCACPPSHANIPGTNYCCPKGTALYSDGSCAPCPSGVTNAGSCSCPLTQWSSSGQCCPKGLMAQGALCVPSQFPSTCSVPLNADGQCCPPGELFSDSSPFCYTPALTINCPPGSQLRDGKCVLASPTQMVPNPSPPPPCEGGLVPREAFPGDQVCVSRSVRDLTIIDNREAPSHTRPDGACQPGYVWREARADDHVCVPPATRTQIWTTNRQQCGGDIHCKSGVAPTQKTASPRTAAEPPKRPLFRPPRPHRDTVTRSPTHHPSKPPPSRGQHRPNGGDRRR